MTDLVSDTAQRIYVRLRPYHADGDDAVLLRFCEALALTLRKPTEALRHDEVGSGHRRMLDPARAPDWMLPWLAQFAGLDIQDLEGLADDQRRALIRDTPNFRRGTVPALTAAISTTLTGSRTVRLRERHNPATPGVDAPYHLTVVTRSYETPNPPATLRTAISQKPAGLVLHMVTTTGLTWDELTGATWDDDLTGVTWDDLQNGYTIGP